MKCAENNAFFKNTLDGLVYMTSPNIDTTHAFTTRIGGVSNGVYESLNLAHRAGDDPEKVRENYTIICRALGISIDDIVCSNQVHETYIRVVTDNDRGGLCSPRHQAQKNPYHADGLITNNPGLALMIFIADCVPVLLYDPIKTAIGAVHAGWRGTVSDIACTAVRKMESEFGCVPADIKAAIGPCISKCCYETNADVADAIRLALPEAADDCFTQHGDKYMVDLKKANYLLLRNAGLSDIVVSDECTSCNSDKYWSHRKTNGQRGSQAAVIMLKGPTICKNFPC